jgi:hypothetical protein
VVINIGRTPIRVDNDDAAFGDLLRRRYGNFTAVSSDDPIVLTVELVDRPNSDADLSVIRNGGLWRMERGDFRATYDPVLRQGHVRQTANPWSIDAVIRIVHSLELARCGGFLIHAASAIRNGRGWVFAGQSGAGKTTLARLAPADVTLLTDEISFIRPAGEEFFAWGTPFAGELGIPGDDVAAPVAAICFPEHAPHQRLTRMGPAEALKRLMKNILFFADDPELVQLVFETAARFVEKTSVYRLEFQPDVSVWSLME